MSTKTKKPAAGRVLQWAVKYRMFSKKAKPSAQMIAARIASSMDVK